MIRAGRGAALLAATVTIACASAGGRSDGGVVLPAPTGSHAVGTRLLHLVDDARPEALTDDPGDRRELVVQLWYPTEDEADRAPYRWRLDALRPVVGSSRTSRLAEVVVHGREDARPAAGPPRPIVLFSHGTGLTRAYYTAFAEDLASHGYVVAGIDHLLDAGPVALPDGRVVVQHPRWARREPEDVSLDRALAFRAERLRTWIGDAGFVLDRLAAGDAAALAGPVDLDRVGYFGHSLGGRAAALACRIEERVDACANLDGWPPLVGVEEEGLDRPYLHAEEVRPERSDSLLAARGFTRPEHEANVAALDVRMARFLGRMREGALHARIAGADHATFSDLPLVFPGDDGTALAPERGIAIVRSLLLGFFDRHLRGGGDPVASIEGAWPEVVVVRHEPARSPGFVRSWGPSERLEEQRRAGTAIAGFGEWLAGGPAGGGIAAVVAGPEIVWARRIGPGGGDARPAGRAWWIDGVWDDPARLASVVLGRLVATGSAPGPAPTEGPRPPGRADCAGGICLVGYDEERDGRLFSARLAPQLGIGVVVVRTRPGVLPDAPERAAALARRLVRPSGPPE